MDFVKDVGENILGWFGEFLREFMKNLQGIMSIS